MTRRQAGTGLFLCTATLSICLILWGRFTSPGNGFFIDFEFSGVSFFFFSIFLFGGYVAVSVGC